MEENGLLKLTLNEDNDKVMISARELYKGLGIKERFSSWFERNGKMFIDGEDFTSVSVYTEVDNNGGIQTRILKDYNITIDMAKNICLMSNTDKGKQYRQALIQLENDWNTPEKVMARALLLADKTINNLKSIIKEQEIVIEQNQPKVDFATDVESSNGNVTLKQYADIVCSNVVVNLGRNQLFDYLRRNKILCKSKSNCTLPLRAYIKSGWFEVTESTKNGMLFQTTLVTPKGQLKINEMLHKTFPRGEVNKWSNFSL